MKKYMAAICLVGIICVFISLPAMAQRAPMAEALTVLPSQEHYVFSKSQPEILSYSVANTGSVCGAREYVYIDGILASNENPNYFLIFNKSSRNVSFNIPDTVAWEGVHTLTLRLCMQDGSVAESTATFETDEAELVNELVKPVVLTAYVQRDTSGYSSYNLKGYCTTIPMGSYVEYLNPDSHDSLRSARVRTSWGGVYWVNMADIYITTGDYVIADNLTPEQKEIFVNSKGYESKTPYLIWVNTQRQILNVFMGSKGSWDHLATFPVATGKHYTPTPVMEHEIEYVTRWVNPSYTCYPVLSLYNGYAIHNQPVNPRGYVTDSTIGKPASAGCVRMLQKDIDWVHSVVPVKTNVIVY